MSSPPKKLKIALVGNPNSGKSSLFNLLTGLNQRTGNFPGVTVECKTGLCSLPSGKQAVVTDLPGIYSIYPKSLDEAIVTNYLLHHTPESTPDKILVVADITNLQRGLLLLTQIIDLGLPALLVLSMPDLGKKAQLDYDLSVLSKELDLPVCQVDCRKGTGLLHLKEVLELNILPSSKKVYAITESNKHGVQMVRDQLNIGHDYEAYLLLKLNPQLTFLSKEKREKIKEIINQDQITPTGTVAHETLARYGFIQNILSKISRTQTSDAWKYRSRLLDKILTHKIWGYVIFTLILLTMFQAIFSWAEYPMDWIDAAFSKASESLKNILPDGPLTRLLTEGVIPGLGGIMIFIPQIAILFAFISLLEESGYMARVVFLMDKIMRKYGLNGRSIVPLISGVACAIPAIMSTRTIENWKERLITIFVTPFVSCSARLPVYTILIALIIPDKPILGFLNLQGLALMGLYLLGFGAAILAAWIMKLIIKTRDKSFLIMELPTYRLPRARNVLSTIWGKTRTFVFEAGKIILAISIVLWALASYGPGNKLSQAEDYIQKKYSDRALSNEEMESMVAAYRLENSYAGIIGKTIEPLVKPLGYDWKIGIALISSFAAREVFVGTMATIYSVGSEDEIPIRKRMAAEINPETGGPRFTFGVGLSLLVFYAFAMQCMSTLAVVYRETNGWKWPLIQLLVMTAVAYISALFCYQVFG